MRWATRAGIHIDRAACAWLIRRHIDNHAEFLFVADPAEIPAEATAFDIPGADLSHHGGDCSFETILRRYDLADPVLWRIAAIVHEADLHDQRYQAPEAEGLDVILRGLATAARARRAKTRVACAASLLRWIYSIVVHGTSWDPAVASGSASSQQEAA
jgi:hypothetical protein